MKTTTKSPKGNYLSETIIYKPYNMLKHGPNSETCEEQEGEWTCFLLTLTGSAQGVTVTDLDEGCSKHNFRADYPTGKE
jgi:hypothetical protein